MKRSLVFVLALVIAGPLFAEGAQELRIDTDVVEVAVSNGSFNTLAAALEATGLVSALQGDGPFTVFAPTDEAFAKLPDGTVESLLGDIPTLTNMLLYHVSPGRMFSDQVAAMTSAETLSGAYAPIEADMAGVSVAGSNVVAADVLASNGVIHVVDTVMLPPSETIVDVAVSNDSFSTLVAAVEAADLVETLAGEGPFTVFAPTDEAFAKLPEGTVSALLNDIPTLSNILLYHVVPGIVPADQVVRLDSAETALGRSVMIDVNSMGVFVDDARVIATDIFTSNGVVHVIDSVILPE